MNMGTSADDPIEIIRRRFEQAAAMQPAPASRRELAERAGSLSGAEPSTGGRYILDILQRPANTMRSMQSTFVKATGAQSPMAHVTTQVGIAWSVLPDRPLVTADFTAGYVGVPAVATYLGQELTPEQADDVQRGVEEIHADPELSGRIHRVVGRIDWSQIRDLSPKA
jgi:hypothetical protein